MCFREAFKKKKNGEIWELFPIGWVGLHPVPNFLTGFKKHSECSETHNKTLKKIFFFGGGETRAYSNISTAHNK